MITSKAIQSSLNMQRFKNKTLNYTFPANRFSQKIFEGALFSRYPSTEKSDMQINRQ